MAQKGKKEQTKSSLRRAAGEVVQKLTQAGFEAYFAGGCVRDMLMGMEPKDIDIATDATPEAVQEEFPKTYAVGAQFGVVVVLHGRHQFEVATFRVDSMYSDGRHPDSVKFGDARADVMRRDFTINGMLYDPIDDKVIDWVGGQKDLKKKVIRCIGEPLERLSEDKLRMLRAVRFSCRLGFEIEPATLAAIRRTVPQIGAVSQERIKAEIEQITTGKSAARGVRQMFELGLLRYVLPEANALSEVHLGEGTMLDHAAKVIGALHEPEFDLHGSTEGFGLALAALLHCAGGTDEEGTLEESARLTSVAARRLKCSNAERATAVWLVQNQFALDGPGERKVSYLKRIFAHRDFGELLALFGAKAECGCASRKDYEYIRNLYSRLSLNEIKPEPLLGGNDLIEMGLKPSELFSVVLDRVYDAQLDGEVSDREAAIELALKIAREL